jgi:hypothetical protein
MPSTRRRSCPGGSVRGRGPARSRPLFVRAFTSVAPGFPAGALVRDGRRAIPGAVGRVPRRLPSRSGAGEEEARGAELSRPLQDRDERTAASLARHRDHLSSDAVATGRAGPLVRVRPEVRVLAADGPTGRFKARPEGLSVPSPARSASPRSVAGAAGSGPGSLGRRRGPRPPPSSSPPTSGRPHSPSRPAAPSVARPWGNSGAGGCGGTGRRGRTRPGDGGRTSIDGRGWPGSSELRVPRGKTRQPGGAQKPQRPATRASRVTGAGLGPHRRGRNREEAEVAIATILILSVATSGNQEPGPPVSPTRREGARTPSPGPRGGDASSGAASPRG